MVLLSLSCSDRFVRSLKTFCTAALTSCGVKECHLVGPHHRSTAKLPLIRRAPFMLPWTRLPEDIAHCCHHICCCGEDMSLGRTPSQLTACLSPDSASSLHAASQDRHLCLITHVDAEDCTASSKQGDWL